MSGLGGRLLRRLGRRGAPLPDTPQPARPLYAVGDIHGRADLLDELLALIELDARETGTIAERQLVFLGDAVDRGEESRAVLERIQALVGEGAIALMGNHESMLLDFLDDPFGDGLRWLRHGGAETLASFGIAPPDDDLAAGAAALRRALTPDAEAWLRALPLWHRSGDVVCVHAALDPDRAPEEEEARILLWGSGRFTRKARGDGLWVAHGHTVTPIPGVEARRIACDTGAYFTDRLTAAAIHPGESVRFLTTAAA